MILLPNHLAEAIEWVLKPKRDAKAVPPDLTRLTSEQMQVLPLSVAHDFMELTLAAQNEPARRRSAPADTSAQWQDRFNARARQRARRASQRAQALTAAHSRLHAWYVATGSALQRGYARERTS